MKRIIAISVVLSAVFGFAFLYWSHVSYSRSLESQGVFEEKINDEVQEFFQEVSEGSGHVEVAGFPGSTGVYRFGAEITFVIQSERGGINGYLSIHIPANALASRKENGEIHTIVGNYGGVIPACFSFDEGGGTRENPIKTTYNLGQDAAFDDAFLGFIADYDASEDN